MFRENFLSINEDREAWRAYILNFCAYSSHGIFSADFLALEGKNFSYIVDKVTFYKDFLVNRVDFLLILASISLVSIFF
jgi:hypothetical protein